MTNTLIFEVVHAWMNSVNGAAKRTRAQKLANNIQDNLFEKQIQSDEPLQQDRCVEWCSFFTPLLTSAAFCRLLASALLSNT